jgi:hypothetical protein
MERAVGGAGGVRSPPIGGAQRSGEGAGGGGGGSTLKFAIEIWGLGLQKLALYRETIFRMHLALTASAYSELSGVIIICSQSGFSESLENSIPLQEKFR